MNRLDKLAMAALATVLAIGSAAQADLVVYSPWDIMTADSRSNRYAGQSVTMPTGTQWNNITFNFFSSTGEKVALGDLFLFSTSYTQAVEDLVAVGQSSAGFIAKTSSIVDGSWAFDSGVTLQKDTMYYFYAASMLPNVAISDSDYQGGQRLMQVSPIAPYAPLTGDWCFALRGTPVVPVPGATLLAMIGLFCVVLWQRRFGVNLTT